MTCPSCNKKFLCEEGFNLHMKIHTLGEAAKKHECEYCRNKFFTQAHYRRHVAVSHTVKMWYKFKACDEKFGNSAKLSHHRYAAHGIKPQSRKLIRVNE